MGNISNARRVSTRLSIDKKQCGRLGLFLGFSTASLCNKRDQKNMDIHLEYGSNGDVSTETLDHIRLVSNQHGNLTERSWDSRRGSADLVTVIEISGLFVGMNVVDDFIGGLVGKDIFEEMGSKTQTSIMTVTKKHSAFIKELYGKTISKNKNRYGAFALVERFNGLTLYTVVNHLRMNAQLIDKLPEAMINAIAILAYLNIEGDPPIIAQLYPNFETGTWDYILIPTPQAFGKHVDRYIDIKDKCIYEVSATDDFIKHFKPDERDDFKFLISSDRNNNISKFSNL